MTVSEIRSWIELIILIGLGINQIGKFWQKNEDAGEMNRAAIAALRAEIRKDIEGIHRRLDETGRELSKWGSYLQGIEERMRKIFCPREVCDEKMDAIVAKLKVQLLDRHPSEE